MKSFPCLAAVSRDTTVKLTSLLLPNDDIGNAFHIIMDESSIPPYGDRIHLSREEHAQVGCLVVQVE